jgi:large subunit ribosomal protein L4
MSLRNLQNVHVIPVDQLNAYDVLHAEDLVFTAAALTSFVGASVKSEEVSA